MLFFQLILSIDSGFPTLNDLLPDGQISICI